MMCQKSGETHSAVRVELEQAFLNQSHLISDKRMKDCHETAEPRQPNGWVRLAKYNRSAHPSASCEWGAEQSENRGCAVLKIAGITTVQWFTVATENIQ